MCSPKSVPHVLGCFVIVLDLLRVMRRRVQQSDEESETPITQRKWQWDDSSSDEDDSAGASTSRPRGAGSKQARGQG